MTLEILSPEKKIFSGEVYGVQLPGIEGSFEILDKHASMIATLGKGKINVLVEKNKTETYTVADGFVEVLNNKTTVLVEKQM